MAWNLKFEDLPPSARTSLEALRALGKATAAEIAAKSGQSESAVRTNLRMGTQGGLVEVDASAKINRYELKESV